MPFNELFHYPQPDSRPEVAFRCKESFEDSVQMLLRNACAMVANRNLNLGGLVGLFHPYMKDTSSGHRIDGVGNEVRKDLHQLAFARSDRRMIFESAVNCDSRSIQLALIDGNHVLDEFLEKNGNLGAILAIVAECLASNL